ncbi:MAG: hypothetical protein P9L99_05340 [Candidatus Lernaella stagnicola]|nr:hypothetical protein [Candidatus Lernaella stagnicola]
MGASKINIKNVKSIDAVELQVGDFELKANDSCSIVSNQEIDQGELVLIKASFKNACENEETGGEDAVLFRRRVVPFLTRVTRAVRAGKSGRFLLRLKIENITDDDRTFFFTKYFEPGARHAIEMEFEGKHIRFAVA